MAVRSTFLPDSLFPMKNRCLEGSLRYLFIALCLALTIPLLGAQVAANTLRVAPGLYVPSTSIPYALDEYHGQPELIPIHHSIVRVDNHNGANIAGELAGSFFYKPKITIDLNGQHARTQLHTSTPVFYFHAATDPDSSEDDPKSDTAVIALVRAHVKQDKRVLSTIRFTQFTEHAKRHDGVIASDIEKLPGGWFRVTPQAPMPPGEYAVMPIPRIASTFSTVVFDFGIDPHAPQAKDAVTATVVQKPPSKI